MLATRAHRTLRSPSGSGVEQHDGDRVLEIVVFISVLPGVLWNGTGTTDCYYQFDYASEINRRTLWRMAHA